MATRQTLLQIVQEVSRRHGLSIPTAVVASQNETVQQLYGLANETVQELNARFTWPQLITRFTFNHANSSEYGALQIGGVTAASATAILDWKYFQERTLWDATAGLELIGPVNDKDWQAMVNLDISAGRYSFRFYGDWLRIFPVPTTPADVDFRLEYYSSAPVVATGGSPVGDFYSDDTDYCRLPSSLVVLGMRWRYKKEKGLPYAEDKDLYEMECGTLTSNTGQEGMVKLDQDSITEQVGPMIMIHPGSWPIP